MFSLCGDNGIWEAMACGFVLHITSIYKMCPPPKWTINAPALTNHRTEPIFCMDTPLGTTAGYSGAIFEI